MKKLLLLIVCLSFSTSTLFAQISVQNAPKKELIISKASKQVQVYKQTSETGVTYILHLATAKQANNIFEVAAGGEAHSIDVMLGDKQQAIALLKSMYDYKEVSDNNISLNNPSNNTAQLKKVLGARMYYIYDPVSNRVEQLGHGFIPALIDAITEDF